jgi:hypothetical protein
MFFGIIWIVRFISAKANFVTMMSVCTYYFSVKADVDKKNPEADVGLSLKYSFLYHIGSLAYGSFILFFITFARIWAWIIENTAKRAGDKAGECFMKCILCCLTCLENTVEYLNDAAYAYIACSGKSFSSSAWNGFLLNLKHGPIFATANMLAKLFIVLNKICITVLNVYSCYLIMKMRGDLDDAGM